jgi:dolichol-phosphate mannosyltransferase
VCSGYKRALSLGADVVIKIDGDGQMDPSKVGDLIAPILYHRADYAKGARFYNARALRRMPIARLIGNLVCRSSLWLHRHTPPGARAAAAGYPESWFFFETDMLIHLYYLQAVVADVQTPAHYDEERSTLSPSKCCLPFPVS